MTPCTVCGLPGEPLRAMSGWPERDAPSPGAACSPECATFIFVRPRNETPDERKLTAWAWRKRRAEARGGPFDEPCPMTEADRKWLVWCSLHRGLVEQFNKERAA